ncbi:hypothetical protein MSAN_00533400 [Mycena sanguinolenta]|uniref:Uncharacterized protein n=1 Tax=Mycena sanguinolenta TaxID=230812 RepID=A0A8H6Z630_9AGAR|nr:hypothetical protein MSAN_00533400 [Mycena sanguinolenta]
MIIRLSLLALCASVYTPGCISAVSNRTIDDVYGDAVTGLHPSYGPPQAPWNSVVDNNCTACLVQPDAAQTVDHSWHDVTADGATYAVTIQFTGTAIYFFGIVPNTVPGHPLVTRAINTTFSLDGASAGSYVHFPDPTTTSMLYHVPMLAVDNLSNTAHTLVAQAHNLSLLIFDYAIYTFDDEEAAPTIAPVPTTDPIGASKSSAATIESDGTGSSTRIGGSTATSSASKETVITVEVTSTASSAGSQNSSNETAGSSGSHFPAAIVVGSICGVLGVISLAGAVWCRKNRREPRVLSLEPFLTGQGQAPDSGPKAKITMQDSAQFSAVLPVPGLKILMNNLRQSHTAETATALPPYTP